MTCFQPVHASSPFPLKATPQKEPATLQAICKCATNVLSLAQKSSPEQTNQFTVATGDQHRQSSCYSY